MSNDNSYVTRASDATNALTVNQNRNTSTNVNLDVGSGSSSRIRSHASNNGYTGYSELNTASAWDMWINLETTYPNGGWVYFKINNDSYIQLSGSDNKVNIYKDAPISGNLDVGGIMNTTQINITNVDPNNYPLVITNNGGNWFQGEYMATANDVGCLFRYKTGGSSSYWWTGVWGANTNEFNIWYNYQGLSLKPNGSAVLSGSLIQNPYASLKDNVADVDFTDCTNMLENINVKTYTRDDMEEGNERLGFIAQDVKAYLPDKFDNIIGSNIITDEQGENSKEIMTMDCARMACALWTIVQNQNEKIKALESKWKSKRNIIMITLFFDYLNIRNNNRG